MSRDQNTYAKRARETEKRRKAEAKRQRRLQKKEQGVQVDSADNTDAPAADTDVDAPRDAEG